LIDKVDKSKRKFVEIKVVSTRIDRSKIIKRFRDIEVFAISKNIEFFAILEDVEFSSTIKNIEFSTICEDIEFLTILIDSISKKKLFLFITREYIKEKQI